jgi:hypothetical protein
LAISTIFLSLKYDTIPPPKVFIGFVLFFYCQVVEVPPLPEKNSSLNPPAFVFPFVVNFLSFVKKIEKNLGKHVFFV